jgi:hypothetical protein
MRLELVLISLFSAFVKDLIIKNLLELLVLESKFES